MRPTALRVRTSMLLAATLLPLSSLADPVYFQLTDVGSEVDAPGLSAGTVAAKTRYGIAEAVKAAGSESILMDPQHEGASDVNVTAKVTRAGEKYRLTYQLQTTAQPVRTKTLAYDFVNPSLSDKGAVVMAQSVLAEAEKLGAASQEVPTSAPSEERPASDFAPATQEEVPAALESRSASGSTLAVDAPTGGSMGQDSMGRDASEAAVKRSFRSGMTTLDLGVSLGFNSPSGVFGGEVEYRLKPWLGLNVSGGAGAWGVRVGPLVRLYPLGEVPTSPFVEAGTSFNFGGESWSEVNGGERRYADMLLTPVATVGVGVRRSLGPLYLGTRVGWGFRMREDNWRMRDGGQKDFLTATAVDLTQHGGFLFSFTAGVAVF
ncbi:hypothetical protein G4177_00700 [Corallococcus sp. ZKHCc1 1396]|uniref:Outer membrane protein beta-barrel domain-containing protein n=1 Tax=Corallococcus soli TaxID=2710757 RepID=A0ABR9PFK0_9BACT|nr:hypothetical protein [Corallococcus soli]MBE4746689.1 hypothetical protein [Corallococcus soli]